MVLRFMNCGHMVILFMAHGYMASLLLWFYGVVDLWVMLYDYFALWFYGVMVSRFMVYGYCVLWCYAELFNCSCLCSLSIASYML